MELMDSMVKLSSDAMHNRNCYAYFFQLNSVINDLVIQLLPRFAEIKELIAKPYNEKTPYGDLYSCNIAALETIIEQNITLSSAENAALDDLIEAIYHNNNQILDQTQMRWLNHIISQKGNPSAKIKATLKDPIKTTNHLSPHDAQSLFHLISNFLTSNFKPQFGTNIPTIKKHTYTHVNAPIEYRFSTQAQRHNGKARVSPLFVRCLKIRAKKFSSEHEMVHIYFNNLGYNRNSLDMAGSKEKDLTNALHELEKDPTLKIIVITLPAHKGLMSESSYKITNDKQSYSLVFNELLAVAQGQMHQSGISDFRISQQTRKLLFQTSDNEEKTLNSLLIESFKAHGTGPNVSLSTAQKQAIWLHFIKYELTNFIINKVSPKSYNFSCKDAIDRGAVSSAYFNLMKSFELEKPMQRDEFECALDAAAASVKGRGMNFHRKIIWNALDSYVNANYEDLKANKDKFWLIYWRDFHCPNDRIKQLFEIRQKQILKECHSLPEDKAAIRVASINLLTSIKKLSKKQGSHIKLLFELLSLTSQNLFLPSSKLVQQYQNLALEFKVKHPLLMIIGGMMEILLGALIYLPSFGYSKKLITHGLALSNYGLFASQHNLLSKKITELISMNPTSCISKQ